MKEKVFGLSNYSMVLAVVSIVVAGLYIVKSLEVAGPAQLVFTDEMITIGAKPAARTVVIDKAIVQTGPQKTIAAPLPIVPPTVISRLLPVYPASVLDKGLSGTVLLSVLIGSDGQAGQIAVKQASGIAELDAAALSAISQWKFQAATQGGAALVSWLEIPVKFEVN